jgi:16S rRNA (uracil1498-N3)-methyltransferase
MRSVFLTPLAVGEIELPDSQAHHLRDVLRLAEGARIDAFDDAGSVGHGTITSISKTRVAVNIESVEQAAQGRIRLTIASALPKGSRVDWMIEKLSELGVSVFVPLIAHRSVVLSPGESKLARWKRLAVEASEQSGRRGIMQIHPPTELQAMLDQATPGLAWHLSTAEKAQRILDIISSIQGDVILFVGPEGGWTEDEISEFESRRIAAVSLTRTVLRVETAAIAAAAIIQSA